jgi:putative tricarboxylic transport membrane protein
MEKSDRYTSIIYAAFGLFIAFEGYRLELGTLRAPKPGFLVFWGGIALSILSLVLFIQTFLPQETEKRKTWKEMKWQKGVKLTTALFFYAIVLRGLGFLLSTFFLLLFLLKGLEPQRWRVALILSIVATALCYWVFGVLFELRFPEGILEAIFERMF